MADVKWIKIQTDLFDNRKIRQIESLPDGDAVIVIWVKLLCLAGNINDSGYLYFTKEIPYTEQMLASQFNRPLTVIQMALKIFEQFEMVEIIDNLLHISNWEKYQNVEGMEKIREQTRVRVAKYREKQKELECNVTRNADVTDSNATDIDIDKEIDIEIEKERELEEEKNKSKSVNKRFTPPTLDEVKDYICEKGYSVDAEYWYNYYQSNGWKVGRNKMVDWKACVSQWNAREKKDKPTNKSIFEQLADA